MSKSEKTQVDSDAIPEEILNEMEGFGGPIPVVKRLLKRISELEAQIDANTTCTK